MSVVTIRPETQQMPLGGLQNLCHHFLEVILTMDLTGHQGIHPNDFNDWKISRLGKVESSKLNLDFPEIRGFPS